MPKHTKTIRDPVLEKAIAGYTKDPSTIDIFSAKDKQYSKKVNDALHHNLPSSVVKNASDEPVETLLNVSSKQDQGFVSDSFGHNYRVALAHQEKAKPPKPKHDPTLEKAIAGYTKDTSKIDIFSAQDKLYTQQVNFGLSHHKPASSLKVGTPEQAPGA